MAKQKMNNDGSLWNAFLHGVKDLGPPIFLVFMIGAFWQDVSNHMDTSEAKNAEQDDTLDAHDSQLGRHESRLDRHDNHAVSSSALDNGPEG